MTRRFDIPSYGPPLPHLNGRPRSAFRIAPESRRKLRSALSRGVSAAPAAEERLALEEPATDRDAPAPGPARRPPGPVNSAHGRIEEILFALPRGVSADREGQGLHFENLISSLERSLPGIRSYLLIHHPDDRDLVAQWCEQYAIDEYRWLAVETPIEVEIWAQDPYAAMGSAAGPSILQEGVFYGRGSMVIADEMAAGLRDHPSGIKIAARQSFLFFEGGNMLTTPDYVLLGVDDFWTNYGRPGLQDPDEIYERFASLFLADESAGRVLHLTGLDTVLPDEMRWGTVSGRSQPVFHIDMNVTPTGVPGEGGREIVLYGTPREARRLAGGRLPFEDGLDETFEDFEKDLNQFFDVRPMPLVPWHSALPALGWHDAQQYYLTWNNVVLESYTAEDGTAVRNVFMPAYGEKAEELGVNPAIRHFFDSRAEEVWRQLKFRVHRLAGMEDLAFFGGSAHCITKTLRRGPFRPPAA